MNLLDGSILVAYLAGMIALSVYLGKGQATQEDYFVGGRNLPWWAVGLSTMATQTSAISFISIPAFVALRSGGGLTWLQYELAVPLALLLVMAFLLPFFRRLELVSVYEYLEYRFSPSVRTLVSFIFLVSRGLGTGVTVYASAIVLSVCLEIPLGATILIIGIVTLIYDTLGGISAVVYSDVIQMTILLAGILLCLAYALADVGGIEAVLRSIPEERLRTIDPATGLGDGGVVPFWAFLIGGFFLYASYYGADQSQVQRELSAPSADETRLSLLFNGLARFPLTLLYVSMGLVVGTVYALSPELRSSVPPNQPDYLIPQFILLYLPPGVRAILFAALLASAMSSLDSALNSLSAATMRDFIQPCLKSGTRVFLLSKVTTVAWGLTITGFAFLVGRISPTIIESINKIGSAFYGPILAAFLVGVLSGRANAQGVLIGILAGVGLNLFLWLGCPEIHWMWWNCFGCLTTALVALLGSRLCTSPPTERFESYVLRRKGILKAERRWLPAYLSLSLYFLLMLGSLLVVDRLVG
jgi:SSS family solute:Na+ symporter